MGALFYDQSGRARLSLTFILVVLAAIPIAIRVPEGLFAYKSDGVLAIIVPIAGTLVALALPAAQLAQSVMESFLSSAQELIKGGRAVHAVADFLGKVAVERRRDLEGIRCVIVFSVVSFLLGLFGTFNPGSPSEPFVGSIVARDLLASLATTSLVASVAWLMPVVWSSFNFAKADQLVDLLKKAPETPVPPAIAAPVTPASTPAPIPPKAPGGTAP
jgi:hypothetical protein